MRAKLITGIVCVLIGLGIGFGAGWGLSRMPGETHLSRSYCVQCGMQRTQESMDAYLGDIYSTEKKSGGAIHAMLMPVVGTHNHVWTDWLQIFPILDEAKLDPEVRLKRQLLQMSLNELDMLDSWGEGLGLLSAAFFNDREQAAKFVQKIIEPEAHIDPTVIKIIKRDGDWPLRWKLIDVFLKTYRCEKLPTGITCNVQSQGQQQFVFKMSADGYSQGAISWSDWRP